MDKIARETLKKYAMTRAQRCREMVPLVKGVNVESLRHKARQWEEVAYLGRLRTPNFKHTRAA